jgi:hypothetical protein
MPLPWEAKAKFHRRVLADIIISNEGDIERYSAAHVKIPADNLEVIVHDTQDSFLENLFASVKISNARSSYKRH